ncbi:MAG: hypothetical protein AAF667_01590 [Pseudomonadota bacterium]
MPLAAAVLTCACASGDALPRTLSEQRDIGQVTRLAGDLETLALLGTQLSDALITTNNGAALITGRGGYAAYQPTSAPLRLSSNRVNLRVAPNTAVQLSRTGGSGERPSVIVSATDGVISHRVVANGTYDRHVIGALDAAPKNETSKSADTAMPDGTISLAAVRSARERWDTSDSGRHLNDIIEDRGVTRLRTLPHVGKNRAWPVVDATITSFVTYLADKQIGHGRFVPAAGLMQGDIARRGAASMAGNILLVNGGDRHFALDVSQIGAAWVTCFGRLSQLEIYGKSGAAVAVLAADPMSNFGDWNRLLASLPPICRAG